MEINALFRDTSLQSRDFEGILTLQSRIVTVLAEQSPSMAHSHWRLKGDSLEEAMLYPAFDVDGSPSTAALAVLTEEWRGKKSRGTFSAIWNANEELDNGASMTCQITDSARLPQRLSIDLDESSFLDSYKNFVTVAAKAAQLLTPSLIEVWPLDYFEKRVFDDKPGVGWMIYLPGILTTQQVPEARDLVPVHDEKGKQIGTIVASVIDAAFSADNPEHVEIANRIEIRLVDQDLLSKYVDI
jgi:hypothetical protein